MGNPFLMTETPEAATTVDVMARIQEVVLECYGMKRSTLLSRRRSAKVAEVRHLGMWLCRKYTMESLADIGEAFERNHGAVILGMRSLERKMLADRQMMNRLETVRQRVVREVFGS